MPLTGNWTGDPLFHRPVLNPLSYTSQGLFFISLRNKSRTGIVGLYGNITFILLRNCQTIIITTIPFHIPTGNVLRVQNIVSTICYLAFFLKKIMTMLGCEVVVHWSFGFHLHFPDNNIEYLFLCLLAICVSSLEKSLFRCFARFIIRLVFLLFSYKTSLYILATRYFLGTDTPWWLSLSWKSK